MRKRTLVIAGMCAVLVFAAVAAWRWAPRPATPPSAAMRTAAHALVSAKEDSAGPVPQPAARPKTARERVIAAAFELRGKPYKWGAKGTDAYDCSGFTKAAYAKAGVELPDGSFNQAMGEQPLSDPKVLQPGDLILYRWRGSDAVKHVTLYAGAGWVIGTGSPGQPPRVTIYRLASDLVDDGRVLTYRHIVLPDER